MAPDQSAGIRPSDTNLDTATRNCSVLLIKINLESPMQGKESKLVSNRHLIIIIIIIIALQPFVGSLQLFSVS
jgi:hypothetical protein